MKRCDACDEKFEDQFNFCPVDATPLNCSDPAVLSEHANYRVRSDSRALDTGETRVREVVPTARGCEFRVTMIDNASLLERLARELRFLFRQLRQVWPDVKSNPAGFGKRVIVESMIRLRHMLAEPNSQAAIATSLLVGISFALIFILGGRLTWEEDGPVDNAREEQVQLVALLPELKGVPEDRGIGAGTKGRVGLASGKGEGSAPEPKKSTGGGAGGLHDPLPPQRGRMPPPSPIPAPIPKFPPARKLTLPAAGIDIDPALWQSFPMAVYGDPRSKSSASSNGPGDGGGMGTANGPGIGEGSGPGFGPGQGGNIGDGRKGRPGGGGKGGGLGSNPEDPDRVYPPPQVTERARVLAKPEPQYTEDARRNQITGSVVLRVVFSRTGEVTNIRAIQALPFGLTERAIAAARLIRFRPATKDGRTVNVYMQLEYNFNLY